MDFRSCSCRFRVSIGIIMKIFLVFIAVREQKKKSSNDTKRICGAKKHKSPFNHIFSRPYDGLLCIVVSLNVIVLLLLLPMIFCVRLINALSAWK